MRLVRSHEFARMKTISPSTITPSTGTALARIPLRYSRQTIHVWGAVPFSILDIELVTAEHIHGRLRCFHRKIVFASGEPENLEIFLESGVVEDPKGNATLAHFGGNNPRSLLELRMDRCSETEEQCESA
jgi:hypothetical protein